MEKIVYKIPNGKLVKIFLESHDHKINSIRITGDFFMHPEESIIELEDDLTGLGLFPQYIEPVLNLFFSRKDIEAYGISENGLMEALFPERRGA